MNTSDSLRTNGTIAYRLATPQDIDSIIHVMHASFDAAHLARTLFSASGISAYLSQQVAFQSSLGDTQFFVAEIGDTIVAMAEFRRVHNGLFLNQVAVHPQAQSSGVGRTLLRYAFQHMQPRPSYTFGLDVRQSDAGVQAWYRRLGLKTRSTTRWWGIEQGTVSDSEFFVSGLPQAMVTKDAFGFCQISVATNQGRYDVGLLGDDWYRITNVQALKDKGLWAALQKIDANRRVLALLPDGIDLSDMPFSTELLDVTHRMEGEIGRVMNALHGEKGYQFE